MLTFVVGVAFRIEQICNSSTVAKMVLDSAVGSSE
jgi:hypothetical protein